LSKTVSGFVTTACIALAPESCPCRIALPRVLSCAQSRRDVSRSPAEGTKEVKEVEAGCFNEAPQRV